jgi:hypothetical protein
MRSSRLRSALAALLVGFAPLGAVLLFRTLYR